MDRSRAKGWPAPNWLTTERMQSWLEAQPSCECCRTPFKLLASKAPAPDSPSLDRFDTSKPYTEENTRLICWRCNNIKRNYSAADLRLVADWMDRLAFGDEVGKF